MTSSEINGAKSKSRERGLGRVLLGAVGGLTALGLTALAAAGGLSAIYAAAESAKGMTATPPLPVAVEALEVVDSYETTEVFVGRVEPARETMLAFEQAGEVMAVLVDEGQMVKAGQPVATLDTASLQAQRARLEAELTRLKADLALAERTRKRQDRLSGDGFASEQRADEARTSETTTAASIAATEAQMRLVDIDIEKATIHAPFAGVIAQRSVDPGAVVSPGAMVVRVLETDAPIARIGLPPERAAQLDAAATYQVQVSGQSVRARLTAIRPDLDAASRTIPVLFALDLSSADDQGPMIAPFGAVARLSLPLEIQERGAWAPLGALQEESKGLWRILLAQRDAEGRTIVVGQSVEVLFVQGEMAFIRGAIEDGAQYISKGVNRVAIGDVVEATAAR